MDNGMMGTPPMGGPNFMDNGMGQNPAGGDPNMMGDDMSQGLPPMGGDEGMDPSQDNGGNNPFDNNFDAGVEADENEDPENYIKQLTGKLAQKLRSFNKENGQPDESLNKYAAKMVIKAAADGMSPEGRTELKKAVNTAKGSEDDVEDMSSDGSDGGNEETGMDDMEQPQISECYFTKKDLAEALINMEKEKKEEKRPTEKTKKKKETIFSGPRI